MRQITRATGALSIIALLAACSHYEAGYDLRNPDCANESGGMAWHHPTKRGAEFRGDDAKCRSSAAAKAEATGRPGNIFMIADETRACLQKEYGWLPGCR